MSVRVKQGPGRQSSIPLWIVASIGRSVALVSEYQDHGVLYPAGHNCRLTSVMCREDGTLYVTVALAASDPQWWENFEFDQIRPAGHAVQFDLDIEHGYILF